MSWKEQFTNMFTRIKFLFCLALLLANWLKASAQNDLYLPREKSWIAKDFVFHTGDSIKELKLAYTTLGDPRNPAVLVLHGTAGSAKKMLLPSFGGLLFKSGGVLDASRYFIILPDSIGAGQSSKPSDGLRMKFPQYNYDDMVEAQHLLVTQGLGIKHLRLVMGNSMGGMQTWLWGIKYPKEMDGLVPMASTPGPMSGRNWMLRRFITDAIKQDPGWLNGNYVEQPKSLKLITTYFSIATSGGTLGLQDKGPSSDKADAYVDQLLEQPMKDDANDLIYQWSSSKDFDPSQNLQMIQAPVLAINAQDDERNPAQLGFMNQAGMQIKQFNLFLIPESKLTSGHGTTSQAKWITQALDEWLKKL
jgi:homoserine O-acetyltransferase/O-succinyltransferase